MIVNRTFNEDILKKMQTDVIRYWGLAIGLFGCGVWPLGYMGIRVKGIGIFGYRGGIWVFGYWYYVQVMRINNNENTIYWCYYHFGKG